MKYALAFLILLSACAHKPPAVVPTSELAYPLGTYQHAVRIDIVEPQRQMKLRGVIQSREDKLTVVGLSTFGTTIFRIEEDYKTGEIKKEFYLDVIRQHEERFMFFYKLMSQLLKIPKGTTTTDREGARFTLSEPDKNGIARHIKIEHRRVILNIEVTKYEF
ncbi:MAG TPA: hypothetical protein PKC28_13525 [Bdellovibrionales bacterium]|nr:hypothetical protein [Bdellovibrionales bacterium]